MVVGVGSVSNERRVPKPFLLGWGFSQTRPRPAGRQKIAHRFRVRYETRIATCAVEQLKVATKQFSREAAMGRNEAIQPRSGDVVLDPGVSPGQSGKFARAAERRSLFRDGLFNGGKA